MLFICRAIQKKIQARQLVGKILQKTNTSKIQKEEKKEIKHAEVLAIKKIKLENVIDDTNISIDNELT